MASVKLNELPRDTLWLFSRSFVARPDTPRGYTVGVLRMSSVERIDFSWRAVEAEEVDLHTVTELFEPFIKQPFLTMFAAHRGITQTHQLFRPDVNVHIIRISSSIISSTKRLPLNGSKNSFGIVIPSIIDSCICPSAGFPYNIQLGAPSLPPKRHQLCWYHRLQRSVMQFSGRMLGGTEHTERTQY